MDACKRRFARVAAAAVLLAAALQPCAAQDYPSKPILMLMPLQAGSAVDIMMRIVAQKMSDNLGRQVVVENQPGAAGMIGAERIKRAPLKVALLLQNQTIKAGHRLFQVRVAMRGTHGSPHLQQAISGCGRVRAPSRHWAPDPLPACPGSAY